MKFFSPRIISDKIFSCEKKISHNLFFCMQHEMQFQFYKKFFFIFIFYKIHFKFKFIKIKKMLQCKNLNCNEFFDTMQKKHAKFWASKMGSKIHWNLGHRFFNWPPVRAIKNFVVFAVCIKFVKSAKIHKIEAIFACQKIWKSAQNRVFFRILANLKFLTKIQKPEKPQKWPKSVVSLKGIP